MTPARIRAPEAGSSPSATHQPRVHGWRAAVLWSVVAADIAIMVPVAAFAPDSDASVALVVGTLFGAIIAAFGAVGVVLITRLPRNPFGWIYLTTATVISWSLLGVTTVQAIAPTPATPVAPLVGLIAILANLALLPLVGVTGIFVPLLFPTGRLPSSRWRPVAWVAVAAIAAMTAATAVAPGPLSGGGNIENPIGIAALAPITDVVMPVSLVLLVAAFVLAATSVVSRYRAAAVVERQQLRWFLSSVIVMVGCIALGASSIGPMAEAGWIVMFVGLGMVPIATGLAILRYRLYDLDRIVSRTLGWTVATGLLLAGLAAGVIALQALLAGFTQGQTLAVAASTLVAFALFQPVRRRVQRAVDRRFDRARYDAERTAIAFAERLRDETDIETVTTDLSMTARTALAPMRLSIWLRRP